MNKIVKIVLKVTLLAVISFAIYVYFSLAGTPWSKIYYKYQLRDYLSNKYKEEMIVTEAFYNFKDGKYGVRAHPKGNTQLEFSAWQHYDESKKYRDYYPESIWEYQVNSDFKELLEELYPNADRKRLHGIMGISDEMDIKNVIPHYLEVEHFFSLIVNIKSKLTEDMINSEVDKLYTLIEEINQKGASVDIVIIYTDEEDDSKNRDKYININFKETGTYPSKEELRQIYLKELQKPPM